MGTAGRVGGYVTDRCTKFVTDSRDHPSERLCVKTYICSRWTPYTEPLFDLLRSSGVLFVKPGTKIYQNKPDIGKEPGVGTAGQRNPEPVKWTVIWIKTSASRCLFDPVGGT